MKAASAVCAGVAFVTGLIAAWYWLASTRQKIDPAIHKMDNGKDAWRPQEWAENVMATFSEASQLNGIAARWTACSVFFGTLAAALGVLS